MRRAVRRRPCEPSGGRAALHVKESGNGFFSLEFGQANLHDRPDVVTIAGEPRPVATLGLKTLGVDPPAYMAQPKVLGGLG